MSATLSCAAIAQRAAEFGFSAAYCCAPVPQDEAGADVRTLVLLVRAYVPGGRVVDAFYPASNAAYHQTIALATALTEETQSPCTPLSHVRLKPLCARLPAFGRGFNTLSYLPEVGSRFALSLIGLPFEVDAEGRATSTAMHLACASCRRCVEACPTGAISETSFCRSKCLRNAMLSGKPAPLAHRPLYGVPGGAMGVLGCDICQRVCPYNRRAEEKRTDADRFTVEQLLQADDETMKAFAAEYGANYAIKNRVMAQAILAAANQRDRTVLPRLRSILISPSALVREHAAWAVSQLEQEKEQY